MRFILVVCVWLIIVGGLFGYTSQRDSQLQKVKQSLPPDTTVDKEFSVFITPTFAAVKDPFALTAGSEDDTVIEVRLNGELIDMDFTELGRGETKAALNIVGVLQGHNEVYVKGSPPVDEAGISHGIRVQVKENANIIADKTVWSTSGSLVSGSVGFEYALQEGDDHDH